MKHKQDHPLFSPSLNIQTATKAEIINQFDSYDFRDRMGHKLVMCEDFHDLLSRIAFKEPRPDKAA